MEEKRNRSIAKSRDAMNENEQALNVKDARRMLQAAILLSAIAIVDPKYQEFADSLISDAEKLLANDANVPRF